MKFSNLAENIEHIFVKPEFDLKFLLISPNTNHPCCNVHSSCFIRIRLSKLEDDLKKDTSATGNDFRMFKHLKMS